ncbi:MAG: carbohydrate binding domain-containing protein [Bacteriovoracaceae bacterium]
MDKFDYFVSKLKAKGIYIDLNLKVGNLYGNYNGLLEGECNKWRIDKWKGVDLFYSEFISKQKKFADNILNHVNPYTGLSYANDPVVAWIEINNENGLFRYWNSGLLDTMTEPYLSELTAKWNSYLSEVGGWKAIFSFPRKMESQNFLLQPFQLEVRTKDSIEGELQNNVFDRELNKNVQVQTISKAGDLDWSAQLHIPNTKFIAGKKYQIKFKAKASTDISGSKISISFVQNREPWAHYQMTKLLIDKTWQEYKIDFISPVNEENGRITINGIGNKIGQLYIADTEVFQDGAKLETSNWQLGLKTKDTGIASLDGNHFDQELQKMVSKQQISRPGGLDWSVQLHQFGVSLVSMIPIRYSVKLKSSEEGAKARLVVQQSKAPHRIYFSRNINLTKKWKDYSFDFLPQVNDRNVRITISGLGNKIGELYIADTKLEQGGQLTFEFDNKWNLFVFKEKGAIASFTDNQLKITQQSDISWDIQLNLQGFKFYKKIPYQLVLKLQSNQELKDLYLNARSGDKNHKILWSKKISIPGLNEEKELKILIWPSEDADSGSIQLIGMGQRKDLDLKILESKLSLVTAEDINKPNFIKSTELSDYPYDIREHWIKFLLQTEQAYWEEMKSFLKNTIKARSLLIGSQVIYSPAQIQDTFDIIDNHVYWDHPVFPNNDWGAWIINNTAMAGSVPNMLNTISFLASQRIPGKPYIVSEYNHSSPNLFEAETVPTIAAYAALQDWDAFFLYSYGFNHFNDSWKNKVQSNHFDIRNNPLKIAALTSAAKIFREGHVSASTLESSEVLPDLSKFISIFQLGTDKTMPTSFQLDVPAGESFVRATSIGSSRKSDSSVLPLVSDTGELTWGLDSGKSFMINSAKTKAIVGRTNGIQDFGGIKLEIQNSLNNNWGVLLATVIDGDSFTENSKILVTTLGQMKNNTQAWNFQGTSLQRWFLNQNADFITVEKVRASITLPVSSDRLNVWALDPKGNKKEQLNASEMTSNINSETTILLDKETLWYEINVN